MLVSAFPALTDSLKASTVTSDKGVIISRRDTVSLSNTFSLTDALMRNTSLSISDNGGQAGLKTVSLRGLGSAHTSIYIDGVVVGNVQSGQGDIGMHDLLNASSVVIDYAQNTISISTAKPEFGDLPVAGQVRMAAGSFGTYLPSARLDFRLSDRLSLSANASGVISKGDFPVGKEAVRTNNDIAQVRTGLDLFGLMDRGNYHVKAYYNQADRGTPSSLSWPSDDRQKDMNVYLQSRMLLNLSGLYTLQFSVKGAYDDIFYSSSWGDSFYGHTRLQANSSHSFRLKDWCTMSLAADLHWTSLHSTTYNKSRLSSLLSMATAFRLERFCADVALEYAYAYDKGGKHHDSLSPSANIRIGLADGLVLGILGRRMYRIPDFNELYYTGFGNPDLKPEDAWTADICLDFSRNIGESWKVTARLDGFSSFLKSKIISAPTEADPNIWLPYNIGRVRSIGTDVQTGLSFSKDRWNISFNAGYSFLSATDRTQDSYTYGEQIPHTAQHSLTLNGDMTWNRWSLQTIWNLRGGYMDSSGDMSDWNTLDLSFNKELTVKKAGVFNIRLQIKNISDVRYCIVSGYPMPGRSFMGGIEYRF